MTPGDRAARREHGLLIGDGVLLTAATSALALGLVLLLFEMLDGGPNAAWEIANLALMALGGIAGITAAWLLHGRRVSAVAILGGAVGLGLSGLVLPVFALVAMVVKSIVGIFTADELAPLYGVAGVIAGAFVALVLWLLVDGGRDLATDHRRHVRLDIARIVATTALAVFCAAIIAVSLTQPGSELPEAMLFAVLGGVAGGMVIAGADLAVTLVGRRTASLTGDAESADTE